MSSSLSKKSEGKEEEGMESEPTTKKAKASDPYLLNQLVHNPDVMTEKIFATALRLHPDTWYPIVTNRVEKIILDSDKAYRYGKIPSMNALPAALLPDSWHLLDQWPLENRSKLLRFKGMIQHISDPQLFFPKVTVRTQVGTDLDKCLIYRHSDDTVVNEDEVGDGVESLPYNQAKTKEQVFLVPIPGVNHWVNEPDARWWPADKIPALLPTEKDDMEGCNLHIFKSPSDLLLNDVVEVYGDLRRVKVTVPKDNGSDECDIVEQFDFIVYAFERESSHYKEINHIPLDRFGYSSDEEIMRATLMNFLTDSVLGDELTAKYLLCNLVSNVNGRVADFPVGCLAVHVTMASTGLASFFSECLSNLVEQSIFIPNVLEAVHTQSFVPTKNYKTDRLDRSVLQVSKNTHVVFEEDEFSDDVQKRLDGSETAKKNLKNIKLFMERQMLAYSFGFGQEIEFNHDAPVVVFSLVGAKPVLTAANVTMIPLKEKSQGLWFENYVYQFKHGWETYEALRDYVKKIKSRQIFQISDESHKMVTDDFMKSRDDSNSPHTRMDTDDLHRCLTLARLWSRVLGKTDLTSEVWKEIREMEMERKSRILESRVTEQAQNLQLQ